MLGALITAAGVAQATDPAWQEIRVAVTTLCPEADDEQKAAVDSEEIGDWAIYVHHVIRCGDQRGGLNQALLYTEAVAQIEGSVLYLKPDADEAASWRRRAQSLISRALPESKHDPSPATLLEKLQDRLP